MAGLVHRVTMFKLPKHDDQTKLLEQFRTLSQTERKVCRQLIYITRQVPMILRSSGIGTGRAEEDPRAQGFTVVAKTEFVSIQDMRYYDNQCTAHAQLKAVVQSLDIQGVISTYFTPGVLHTSNRSQ